MSAAAKKLLECDVVMKGGVTSGVIYPGAIAAIAERYRLRGVGGASAGAIGAAFGAAAEFGRADDGFEKLRGIPERLKLGELFRGSWRTFGLLKVMTAFTAQPAVLRVLLVPLWLVLVFPLSSAAGVALGVLTAVWGGTAFLTAVGVVFAVVGWVVAIILRLLFALAVQVPLNMFGICTGHATRGTPQLTDWMSERINDLAGLAPSGAPLTFGQLWTGGRDGADVKDPEDRVIDLRMVSTSLSQALPVELPLKSGALYYDPAEWARLFPKNVMDALEAHSSADFPEGVQRKDEHPASLLRLPDAQHLPVIVATRMSLSFPLLISAVPLWAVDYRPKALGHELVKVWFTDGGLASNFPIHMFDRPLATKPTFAINLGKFARADENSDTRVDFLYATSNGDQILSPYTRIPRWGLGAVGGFAGAALSTARNWRDNSHLSAPGYRDRIVQVLQTRSEGGLNLSMKEDVVARLSERGRAAATALLDQFEEPRYKDEDGDVTVSGWENHVWVRYRALMSGLPRFLAGYRKGITESPPLRTTAAYELGGRGSALSTAIDGLLVSAADAAIAAPEAVDELEASPNPRTVIRRVPDI